MGDAAWDEVGQRFGELGRRLGEQWHEAAPGQGAREDARAALDQVSAALERFADVITATVNDPAVRDTAREALGSLGTALNETLEGAARAIDDTVDRARAARHRDDV